MTDDLEEILISLRKDLKLNADRKTAAFTNWSFQRPTECIRYVSSTLIRVSTRPKKIEKNLSLGLSWGRNLKFVIIRVSTRAKNFSKL